MFVDGHDVIVGGRSQHDQRRIQYMDQQKKKDPHPCYPVEDPRPLSDAAFIQLRLPYLAHSV